MEATIHDGYIAAEELLLEIETQYCEALPDAVDAPRKVLAAAKSAAGATMEVA